jgi:TonB family protein
VVIKAVVDEQGNVHDPIVERSSGDPRINQVWLDSLAKWKFKPATLHSKPVVVYHHIGLQIRRTLSSGLHSRPFDLQGLGSEGVPRGTSFPHFKPRVRLPAHDWAIDSIDAQSICTLASWATAIPTRRKPVSK